MRRFPLAFQGLFFSRVAIVLAVSPLFPAALGASFPPSSALSPLRSLQVSGATPCSRSSAYLVRIGMVLVCLCLDCVFRGEKQEPFC